MRGEGEGASHETREREGSTERVDFFFDSLIERTPPPGGVCYLLCSLIKNRE